MKSQIAPRNLSQVSKTGPRRIRGQGMTEYIVVVALVGLTAVVAVGFFGDAVQAQFGRMGHALTGNTAGVTTAETAGKTAADGAVTEAGAKDDLSTYGK